MYSLPYFKERDQEEVLQFMRQHPFALLTGCNGAQQPVATQLPVFVEQREEKLFLTGHLMRNTDHHKAFVESNQVLCVFTGPHTYVSANWYSNPHQASTWNYLSVQAKGTITFLGEAELVTLLQKTSLHFEDNQASSPTVFNNLPEAYRAPLLHAIVAFEIAVTAVENVFKLSQNRDQQNYRQIMEQLNKGDANARAIAAEMKKREGSLFAGKTNPIREKK